MSKRKRGSDSSLELLLDTICNTFGGVLFVAILIIIMLRMTSKSDAEGDTREVPERVQLELENQQAELQGTIATLQLASSGLETSVQLEDAQSQVLLQDVQSKQKIRQELLHSRLSVLDKIAKHQTHLNRTARELDQLDERQKAISAKRQELETKLKAEVASRTEKIDYSQVRASRKDEIGVVLRYGRFYLWHRYDGAGNRVGLNTEEFVVLDDSASRTLATPMPHAGTPIADTSAAIGQLKSRLERFNPTRACIAVIVWPDSFEHFRTFKKVLVQSGLEYRLMPAEDGKRFTDRGGSSDGVQ